MSIMDKIKEATIPSLYSSAAGLGLYYALVDSDLTTNVAVAGKAVPVWAAVGGSAFLGNELGEFLSMAAKKYMSNESELVEKVIPPLASGLATLGVMRGLISETTPISTGLIVGGGGSVLGNYIYNKSY